MDTSVDQARSGPAGAKARQGLTDAKLRDMPLHERAYKCRRIRLDTHVQDRAWRNCDTLSR